MVAREIQTSQEAKASAAGKAGTSVDERDAEEQPNTAADASPESENPQPRQRRLKRLLIGAAVAMRVEDYSPKGKRWWVRLHEKGGKRHEMPAHHNLEAYLDAYIRAAGFGPRLVILMSLPV